MTKKMDDFDNRIEKLYQFLEYRLELENKRENDIILEESLKSDEIIYKRKNKQPIPSSIWYYLKERLSFKLTL